MLGALPVIADEDSTRAVMLLFSENYYCSWTFCCPVRTRKIRAFQVSYLFGRDFMARAEVS